MHCIGLFAVSPVQDLAAALDWYARLFGRAADDRPIPDLAQWYLDGFGFQVMRVADRAGGGMATLVVADIEAERERLAAAGITFEPTVRGPFGAIARLEDPEGNRITLAEPPRG
ncbi:VOC family protein [Pseudoxanthomonas sp. Soil82]|uniref:VOC family protein n=1 Tax=Pseudoxanthomonas sp. Soil82 TaxID=3157341 RepID=UPI00338E8590